MFWADRITKIAGVTLLLLAALIVVNIVLITAVLGDAEPAKRGDIEGILSDIHDNKALYFSGVGFSVVADAVVLPVAAALLYLVFRARSRALALVGLVTLLAASVAFLVEDSMSLTAALLSDDFAADGGAGGIAAGDPVILQSARTLGVFSEAIGLVASMPIALALLSLGYLTAHAPYAEVNPPRWVGILAIVAGVALILSWIGTASEDVGLVVITIGYIGALLWFAILGGWLLLQPEQEAHPATELAYE
jgi:hypothetical protein